MKVIIGGKATDRAIIQQIAQEQAELDKRFLWVEGSRVNGPNGEVIEVRAEDDVHFVVKSSRISLQVSMYVLDSGIMAVTFPSPQVVRPDTRASFVELANALNVAKIRAGLFAVEDLDFYYQAYIPSSFLRADREKARELLLENGVKYLEMMSVPIYGLSKAGWPVEKAIRYVNELFDEGFVYDDDYF